MPRRARAAVSLTAEQVHNLAQNYLNDFIEGHRSRRFMHYTSITMIGEDYKLMYYGEPIATIAEDGITFEPNGHFTNATQRRYNRLFEIMHLPFRVKKINAAVEPSPAAGGNAYYFRLVPTVSNAANAQEHVDIPVETSITYGVLANMANPNRVIEETEAEPDVSPRSMAAVAHELNAQPPRRAPTVAQLIREYDNASLDNRQHLHDYMVETLPDFDEDESVAVAIRGLSDADSRRIFHDILQGTRNAQGEVITEHEREVAYARPTPNEELDRLQNLLTGEQLDEAIQSANDSDINGGWDEMNASERINHLSTYMQANNIEDRGAYTSQRIDPNARTELHPNLADQYENWFNHPETEIQSNGNIALTEAGFGRYPITPENFRNLGQPTQERYWNIIRRFSRNDTLHNNNSRAPLTFPQTASPEPSSQELSRLYAQWYRSTDTGLSDTALGENGPLGQAGFDFGGAVTPTEFGNMPPDRQAQYWQIIQQHTVNPLHYASEHPQEDVRHEDVRQLANNNSNLPTSHEITDWAQAHAPFSIELRDALDGAHLTDIDIEALTEQQRRQVWELFQAEERRLGVLESLPNVPASPTAQAAVVGTNVYYGEDYTPNLSPEQRREYWRITHPETLPSPTALELLDHFLQHNTNEEDETTAINDLSGMPTFPSFHTVSGRDAQVQAAVRMSPAQRRAYWEILDRIDPDNAQPIPSHTSATTTPSAPVAEPATSLPLSSPAINLARWIYMNPDLDAGDISYDTLQREIGAASRAEVDRAFNELRAHGYLPAPTQFRVSSYSLTPSGAAFARANRDANPDEAEADQQSTYDELAAFYTLHAYQSLPARVRGAIDGYREAHNLAGTQLRDWTQGQLMGELRIIRRYMDDRMLARQTFNGQSASPTPTRASVHTLYDNASGERRGQMYSYFSAHFARNAIAAIDNMTAPQLRAADRILRGLPVVMTRAQQQANRRTEAARRREEAARQRREEEARAAQLAALEPELEAIDWPVFTISQQEQHDNPFLMA